MIRLSIRRPVAVSMAYLGVALLGASAWRNIPIELLPDTELPRLTVTGSWPGASPETVEAFLTSPVEAVVQQVRGVERVVSESFEQQGVGTAEIEVEFTRDTDMDFARLDLSERLATLEEELPPGVRGITVQPYVPREFESQAERVFLQYTFTGPYVLEALRKHLEERVIPELTQLEGVALVRVWGGRERLIEVELDEDRVNTLGLTSSLVFQRIADLDLVREAGVIREGTKEWTVTIRNRPSAVQDIRSAVLSIEGSSLVRVADVARVRDTFEDAESYYRIDGRPAAAFVVVKEIGSNTVRVAERVKHRLGELESLSPPGARFILDVDESDDIRRQLSDLRYRAVVAAIVIFLVLLAFLRSGRSAAVVFATIAFSVLIALNLIYFGGLTLNLLTLMGLAMGFGLVVDNSIVVLENVFRRWQEGRRAAGAAEEGAREVVLPILASTATTLIVFVPFVYLQGELRVFYVPLAIVVGLTLLASLFVAFTFTPALAARIFKGDGGGTAAPFAGARRRPLYARFYAGLLRLSLRFPTAVVLVALLVFGSSFYLFNRHVTRGIIWGGAWGQDTYVSIQIRLPRGSDLELTDTLVRTFEARLARMPEVARFTSRVSGSFGQVRVTFPDSLEYTAIPPAIKEQMVAYSLQFTGAEVRVYGFGPSFYGGGGSPPNYSITVLGYNYEKVREIAEDLGRRLRRLSRIRDVDTNASGYWYEQDRATEFVIEIDRDALAQYGMTVQELVERLSSAVRGEIQRADIKIGGEEIRYDVKLSGYRDMDIQAFRNLIIPGPDRRVIRVGSVVDIRSREVLSRVRREDQQYERRIAYEFRGPRKLGDLVQRAVMEATEVPAGYTLKTADTWRWSEEERGQILLVLLVSILLIYMVTASLFESALQPLSVLLTVPMALVGVFLMFFCIGASFTREAYVGVIMMGGIVVNNAILLVDHVNRVRAQGRHTLEDAILLGALERVRPILMTTATTVLGLLPLVLFAEAADANIWNGLAYALIGGLLSSTFFVLTVTPAVYLLIERLKVMLAGLREELAAATGTAARSG